MVTGDHYRLFLRVNVSCVLKKLGGRVIEL